MSRRSKVILAGGVAAALVLWIATSWWVAALVVAGVIAVPVAGYLMLDPSQRRRLRQSRKQIGS